MANDDFEMSPIIMTRFTQGFAEIDYSIPIAGAFEVTVPLQALELEARSKGCAVVIQVALIPLDEFWPDQIENEGESTNDQE